MNYGWVWFIVFTVSGIAYGITTGMITSPNGIKFTTWVCGWLAYLIGLGCLSIANTPSGTLKSFSGTILVIWVIIHIIATCVYKEEAT